MGKIAAKCSNFLEYVRKAQTRLKLSWDLLSDAEVQECFSACLEKLGQYRRLTALRSLLARNVESLVLVDRLCFLLELEDLKSAQVMPLFDPRISPRAFAIIALR